MKSSSLSLARALDILRSEQTRPAEKRRFRRFPLILAGRLRSADGGEFDCRTINVSPGDAFIATSAPLKVGDRILMYVNGLGRIEAEVRRHCGADASFGVRFLIGRHKLERHTDIIMGILYPWARDADSRRFPREAGSGTIEVVLRDGRTISGHVIDMSLVGVSILCAERPPMVGEYVSVSGRIGRVARYFEGGFAIDLRPIS
jgi:hypothetical protein